MSREFKISDFLKRIKNQIIIDDSTTYKRVTISGNHKGVSLRDEVLGSKIGTKKQFTIKGGDFILSKIDARNGAFGIIPEELNKAIITGNFWTYSVDTNLIDSEWFFYFTHSYNFIQICIESSTGSTHRKYLDEKVFLNHKIILPEIEEQKEMVKRYKSSSAISNNLTTEIKSQKKHLSNLKQSILQEAIQGKLTADWRKQNPNTEPASEILNRIKSVRAQLIKDKKIKKEKTLPEITKDEIPFDLPTNWVWCRIPQVLALTKDPLRRGPFGSSLKKDMFAPRSNETSKIYEQQNAIKKDYRLGHYYISTNKYPNLNSFLAGPGDILISCAGTIGETYKLPKEAPIGIINQALLKIRLNNHVILDDFFLMMFKSQLKGQVNSDAKGSAMKNMGSVKYLKNELVFGLPPYKEQQLIIEKVKLLMQKSTALEEEIKTSEANAQMLMQAVLKEAFESKQEGVVI